MTRRKNGTEVVSFQFSAPAVGQHWLTYSLERITLRAHHFSSGFRKIGLPARRLP